MVELAMALVLMNLGSTPEVSGPPVPIRPLMFVVDVGGDHVEAVTRQTLTEALVLTLARRLDLEVQSPRSVRDRVGFAEQQQQAGCDSSACMTEIANAMGARFVVFSRVVRLANDEILRADIYDNVSGRTIALASVQARAVNDLHRQLPDLIESLLRESAGALPLRAVEGPLAVATDKPLSSTARAGLLVGGVGLGSALLFGGLAGAGTLQRNGVGRAADAYSDDPSIDNARALIDARGPFDNDTMTVGICGGGCLSLAGLLALVVGAGLYASDALAPAEEAPR